MCNTVDECQTLDQCQTLEAVQKRLCFIVYELFGDGGLKSPPPPLSQEEIKKLIMDLSKLPYELLQKRENPLMALSEACRLMIRSGKFDFLNAARQLAHTLYQFQSEENEAWRLSYLYKGMAEIGLGEHGIGFKNVQAGVSGGAACGLFAEDRALGYWALASASVRDRDLKGAIRFTEEWLSLTLDCGLVMEKFRALAVLQIFHLIHGNQPLCHQGILDFREQMPDGMEETVEFLEDWTTALTKGKVPTLHFSPDALPLLLGLPMFGSKENKFSRLCNTLRQACDHSFLENCDADELEKLVHLAACWELPNPLQRFERLLEAKKPARYHQILLDRLLGRQISQRIRMRTPEDPEVKHHKDAIILAMDVRNYSTFTRKMEGSNDTDFEVLNPLFKLMNEDLEKLGGNTIEFKGDSIIMAFNTFAPSSADFSQILYQTVRTTRRVLLLSLRSLESGLPEVRIGIGLHRGTLTTGFLGGLDRCFLTPLGKTINLAARLESLSKELTGNIVVSRRCFPEGRADMWKKPEEVNFAVRDMGSLSVKNMDSVEAFALRPLVPYWVDFVSMGFVAKPEPGVVYLDTGNDTTFGIIDHHHQSSEGGKEADSACQLLLNHPELLRGHLLQVTPSSEQDDPKLHLRIEATRLEFRMHTEPDFDCAATFYAACEMMERSPRMKCLHDLALYVSKMDQGQMIGDPSSLEDSLYGIFIAHQHLMREKGQYGDFDQLEAGLRVIDAAMFLMEQILMEADFSTIFSHRPQWFSEERKCIREDFQIFEKDRGAGQTYIARVNRKGRSEKVEGMWLDHPESRFFKYWVRNDPRAPGSKGYAFMVVDRSEEGNNRFIISVDPESDDNLEGLGALLEEKETKRRETMNRRRPTEPKRPGAENSDPWYFGWGHHYTIVDAPHDGTVLSAEEVRAIHESW